jgi:hypothetical protein
MPTLHGIQNNTIYPQPDFTATQNDRGGWTASRTYILTRTTWNLVTYRARFARGNAITDFDTEVEPYHSFLTIESANPTYTEGGLVEVRVEFVGGQVAQYNEGELAAGAETIYRLEGRLGEAPFSQHHKWKALSDSAKNRLGWLLDGTATIDISTGEYFRFDEELVGVPLTGAIVDALSWETASGDELEFAKLIVQGETTFKFPTYTWNEVTQGTSPLTSGQLNLLGKIASPRGNPPEAGGTRDWMLTGASQEQRGELYQTSLEWELSERDGHNSFLYD